VVLALSTSLAMAGGSAAQPAKAAVHGAEQGATRWPTTPRLKTDGRKWRVGYYEGGQYRDYEVILKATLRGLMALGWMEEMPLPRDNNPEPGGFWRWLSANARSDYLEFPPDGWYAAGDFDPQRRPLVVNALNERLTRTRDLDLMLAMGTWAGQDLANAPVDTPVMVASTSNPVASGISVSAEDSGRDHVHAKTEPGRYGRQVELFHDIFAFSRLGLVYEDSVEGRSFAAVEEIESIAKARGFEVVACHAPFNGVSRDEAAQGAVSCYRDIARRADAVYVTVHRGVTPQSLPAIVEPLLEHARPSFSMLGEQEVRQGVLMSIAQLDYIYVGRFHAETMARIFNGALPRDLPQVWQAPSKIALNLETAERIGYDPAIDILMASDEIFAHISPPPD
jgi:ABC-type uncharacterized transport system substrate-binding protein